MQAAIRVGARAGRNLAADHVPERARFLLDWARRYDESFLLLRLPVELPTGEGPRRRSPSLSAQIARITAELRSTDVCWTDAEHLYVMLPRGVPVEASMLVERVARRFPSIVHADAVALVRFPEDGLTLPALGRALGTGAGRVEPRVGPREVEVTA